MADYKAPLRDIRFVRDEIFDFNTLYTKINGGEDATPDMVDAILDEIGRFAEQEIAPTNVTGDREGCKLGEDGVIAPSGFKEVYQKFVEGGWPSLSADPEFGGQGLPVSLGMTVSEIVGQANWSWGMYPGLSHGAKHLLEAHGSNEQKDTFLPRMVSGEWTGTMCLTEPHCGSDLGLLRTKAEANADGSYSLTGTKIFISAGDHDLAENIIHLVLARVPGSPAGTKGISIFVVPKNNLDDSGNVAERNAVSCGALEHKMGIHGNATCVMNFDGAKGFLIGEQNKGLNYMFTMMNSARIGTAFQGLAHSELAIQHATDYARDRLQMRSLSGKKNPDGPADPIIVHPDVRRMLLTIKSLTEGMRMMGYHMAYNADIVSDGKDEEERKVADDLLSILTPIGKAFMTEVGCEAASLGVQVFGGHGYTAEWPAEQNMRDCRISTIYEGTTGIQGLDLLGRKVLGSGGELLKPLTKEIYVFAKENLENEAIGGYSVKLQELTKEWGELTMHIGMLAMENPEEVGAASVDYLMYAGYVCMAYYWAQMAKTAAEKLAAGTSETAFYEAKLHTAKFYFARILPRTITLAATMKAPLDTLMDMDEEQFVIV
ncbi:acyl-CoA dehydrogenase C-terminal domain-containing protein [uncultured Umboniibacter sp.]|uniref:acyl-CoA dehydrogenase C-terminal domain-containing protein n=1 Tax=uncultured Umboniibacter sp. TaxID=1798917 RepID=UPI00260EF676|nr:acyl-CoA dehydrogenase C-terminal domain-containing protein [uncultured Umboniibacter sp.]